MSIAYLKVKVKSLAAEARIIRHEELKWRRRGRYLRQHGDQQVSAPKSEVAYSTFHGLQAHRLGLRLEQRAAYIAYGYLRGRTYRQIEPSPHYLRAPYSRSGPDWDKVRSLIWRYGPKGASGSGKPPKEIEDAIKAWADAPPASKAA